MSTISKFKKGKKGSAMTSAYEQHTHTGTETRLQTSTTSNDSLVTLFAALFYTSLLLLLQEICSNVRQQQIKGGFWRI